MIDVRINYQGKSIRLGPIVRELIRATRWLLLTIRENYSVEFKFGVWETLCDRPDRFIQFGEKCIEHMALGRDHSQFGLVTGKDHLTPQEALAQLICHEIAHIYSEGSGFGDDGHGRDFQKVAGNLWNAYGARIAQRFDHFYEEQKRLIT